MASVVLDPLKIPPEVQMKARLPNNPGRHTLNGPGRLIDLDMSPYRKGRRLQELAFELARDITRDYLRQAEEDAPAHMLFPQVAAIAMRYLQEKIVAMPPADPLDVFLSPYYGWVVERLVEAIKPDSSQNELPELPRYETSRPPGSTADIDFWTSKDVREVNTSHINYAVADTMAWEQSATYVIDNCENVESFVKNAGLGFAIPYLHNGEPHEYVPDFIVRLKSPPVHLILETKGFDPLAEIKAQAATRWIRAVNAEGSFGTWRYAMSPEAD